MGDFKPKKERSKRRSSSGRNAPQEEEFDPNKDYSKKGRRGDRPGRRSSFGRSPDRGSGRSPDRSRGSRLDMHKVKCDRCGEECEVPFKPTSSKPVYCSACFAKKDGRSSRSSSPSVDLSEINAKLDKILTILESR